MRIALALARRALGDVWPNPAVGCVLVRDDIVVGRGRTRPGGRPHAETVAIGRAGSNANGATAYVTLEPCAHEGETPPCAKALIDAGVARCVIAMEDADPRVAGKGIAMLQDANIDVRLGPGADEAAVINEGFFKRLGEGRPLVTLKLATTQDGRIATAGGESQWITGVQARRHGHRLRAQYDAIMVGIGTVRADDPDLTCRLPGLEDRSPLRIVVDTHLTMPETGALVRTAKDTPTWIFCAPGVDAKKKEVLAGHGVQVYEAAQTADGLLDLGDVMRQLAGEGVTRLLVEGGGKLTGALFAQKQVDRIEWFRAGRVIGGDGHPAIGAFGIDALKDAPHLECLSRRILGDDTLESFRVRA